MITEFDMELRQLAALVAVVDSGLNVSQAAERLHLVQSAVSQQLSRLESELGAELFVRKGRRLVALSAIGDAVLQHARRALAVRADIVAVGRDHADEGRGVLRIGTTHTQARYVLPAVIRAFRDEFPQVRLQIHQGTPRQLVEMALEDRVDLSVCTEHLGEHPDLTALPIYRWNRSLIAPHDHPVLAERTLSLETLCSYPLVSYTFGFAGAGRLQATFARAGLTPDLAITATDTDVIKTYVREGLGVGLIASIAYEPRQDRDLVARDLSALLPWETTWVGYQRDKYLRRFQRRFIELLDRMTGGRDRSGGEA